MRHLIVFDLDGTLIDSRIDLAESANELLATYGAGPLDVDRIMGMVGDGAGTLVRRVLKAAGGRAAAPEALDRFLSIYDRRLTDNTRFYPGLEAMIRSLSGRAVLAILTNKPERHTIRLLDSFGIRQAFAAVIGGDSGFPKKPDPAGLLHLIASTGAVSERTLYVGDSIVDVETARRAGVRLCVAEYGFGRFREDIAYEAPDLRADRPEALPAAIETFLVAGHP